MLTPEDDLAGLQNEGPYVNKENDRKAKKGSSKVASQLGVLVTFADRESSTMSPEVTASPTGSPEPGSGCAEALSVQRRKLAQRAWRPASICDLCWRR